MAERSANIDIAEIDYDAIDLKINQQREELLAAKPPSPAKSDQISASELTGLNELNNIEVKASPLSAVEYNRSHMVGLKWFKTQAEREMEKALASDKYDVFSNFYDESLMEKKSERPSVDAEWSEWFWHSSSPGDDIPSPEKNFDGTEKKTSHSVYKNNCSSDELLDNLHTLADAIHDATTSDIPNELSEMQEKLTRLTQRVNTIVKSQAQMMETQKKILELLEKAQITPAK